MKNITWRNVAIISFIIMAIMAVNNLKICADSTNYYVFIGDTQLTSGKYIKVDSNGNVVADKVTNKIKVVK